MLFPRLPKLICLSLAQYPTKQSSVFVTSKFSHVKQQCRTIIATSLTSQRDDEVFMSRLSGKQQGIVVSCFFHQLSNIILLVFNLRYCL